MGAQGRRRAERAPRSRAPLALVVIAAAAIVLTVAAGAVQPWADAPDGGDATTSPDLPSPTPPAPSTSSVDLSNLPIGRSLDCRTIDDEAVRVAIGGPVDRRDGYASGDRAEVAPGVTDVAHEDSCSFANPDVEARVWVFAAPVGEAEARSLVRSVRSTAGCRFLDTSTGFGTPDLTGVCTDRSSGGDAPRAIVASLRGLFGDTWLSCELSDSGDTNRDDVLSRAGQWCVHVATTLGARP